MNPFDLRDDRVSKDHTLAILDDLRTRNRTKVEMFYQELKVNTHVMVDRFFQAEHRPSEMEKEMHEMVKDLFLMAQARIEHFS